MWCLLYIRFFLSMCVLFPQRHLLQQYSAIWFPEICRQYRGRHLLLAQSASQSCTRGLWFLIRPICWVFFLFFFIELISERKAGGDLLLFTSWPHLKASSQVICAIWRKTARGSTVTPVRLLQSPQTLMELEVSLVQFGHVWDGRAFSLIRLQILSRLQSLSSSWRRMQPFKGSWMMASAQSFPLASWSQCVFLFLVYLWSKWFVWYFASAWVHQGKGVPDVNSRLMVRKLWDTLHIPIFALVDADPHGRRHLAYPLRGASHISACLTDPHTHTHTYPTELAVAPVRHIAVPLLAVISASGLVCSVRILTAEAFFCCAESPSPF